MKKLWDEYNNAVMKMPSCTCGAGKEVVELMQSQRLMQFLMDLNESYKTVKRKHLDSSLCVSSVSICFARRKAKRKNPNADVQLTLTWKEMVERQIVSSVLTGATRA